MALILTLALGLSIGGLVTRRRQGLLENIARYFLVATLGVVISALSMILIIIAVWPPYNIFSLALPFGFLVLVLGVLHFVRSTNGNTMKAAGEGE
ncbi:MAG: hypothetical protein ACOY4Q_11915 [Bacillota bacterium]